MISIDKSVFILVALIACANENIFCQETTEEEEQQIENIAIQGEGNTQDVNDISGYGELVKYDINRIDETQLMSFNLLTPIQVKHFILYRKTMGNFISLYELQAIPGWDRNTIKMVITRLTIDKNNEVREPLYRSIKKGSHLMLYRTGDARSDTTLNGKIVSKPPTANRYKQLVKYSFELPEKIKGGVTIEKDAGEKNIADYRSGFLLLSSKRILKSIVMGDYTVNMGQGLIRWQGYSTGMTSQIISGYRQGELIRPHRGTDENRYHRGLGLSFQKDKLTLQLFAGIEKVDANLLYDSINNKNVISSFLYSGLHVKSSELADKKSVEEKNFGGSLTFKKNKSRLSLNHLSTFFNAPVKKRDEPYNYFSFKGTSYKNTGVDFSTNIASAFVFGEAAVDSKLNTGFVTGVMKSLDRRVDLAFIYRNISKGYRSFQSNAFTQNTEANNERGQFISINFRINSTSKIDAYLDQYINRWPQYYTDGSRRGNIFSIQYSWDPHKKTNFYVRMQWKEKNNNTRIEKNKTNFLDVEKNSNCRIHFSYTPFVSITLRQRTEISSFSSISKKTEKGFMSYLEIIYKPMLKPYSISARVSAIETGGYNSRIYAYERDLLSYYSIPALYNAGNRNYIVLNYKINKHLQIWLKWIYAKTSIGDNFANQLESNQKITKEWRMQLIWKS